MAPLIYLDSTDKLPLSVGLAQFPGGLRRHSLPPDDGCVAFISVFPLFIIFFALNRYFVQGVVVSGVKG